MRSEVLIKVGDSSIPSPVKWLEDERGSQIVECDRVEAPNRLVFEAVFRVASAGVTSPFPDPPGVGWVASDARAWIDAFNVVGDVEQKNKTIWAGLAKQICDLTVQKFWKDARVQLEFVQKQRARAALPDADLEALRIKKIRSCWRDGEIIEVRTQAIMRRVLAQLIAKGRTAAANRMVDGPRLKWPRTADERRVHFCVVVDDMSAEDIAACTAEITDDGQVLSRSGRRFDISRRFSPPTVAQIRDTKLEFFTRRDRPVPPAWIEVNTRGA